MATNPKLEKNVFFGINKLPPEKGLLLFGLSMNKLSNRQNADNCLKDIEIFGPTKILKPLVGINFIYSDFLYLYSDKSAPELKNSFMTQVINHKNSMQKLVEREHVKFQIQDAFNFMVWNQLYVGTNDFNKRLAGLKEIYASDNVFQKYIEEDCKTYGKEMGENQINFFLEEILMCYLVSHNLVRLPNQYIQDQQKWILWCYPGRPLKATVYLYQLNPFNLSWPENPYARAHYDLESKQLIEFDRVDLETYSVK